MTYIEALNSFHLWLESNALAASSQLLYFKLLNVFNRAGWPEYVQVDNRRLMSMIDAESEKTVIRARDRLIEAGFLAYQKGRKGCPNRYSVTIGCKNYSVSDSENDSINDSISDSENDSHIKTKTKTKNTPPKSPQGESTFDAFWKAYPRKVGKAAARKAFDRVLKTTTLTDILAAVERQRGCQQWQKDNGAYIPHPATWLNQGRWDDEVDGPPGGPAPARARSYHLETIDGEEVVIYDG